MRAEKCTEGGFRDRAEAQELPSRYRLSRTPAQCLHPPFHSAADWPELNQTKIGPILPFGGSAAILTLRFRLPSQRRRNKVPRNRVPIFPFFVEKQKHLSVDCCPCPAPLACPWSAAPCVCPARTQEGTSPAQPAGQHSSALPCLLVQCSRTISHCLILHPGYLSGSPELCLHLPIMGRMSNICSCTVWSSVFTFQNLKGSSALATAE